MRKPPEDKLLLIRYQCGQIDLGYYSNGQWYTHLGWNSSVTDWKEFNFPSRPAAKNKEQ